MNHTETHSLVANPHRTEGAASVGENFLVDLAGILSILSESIYTAGSEVFLRELLQNGQDAITARCGLEPGFAGAMTLEVLTDDNGAVTIVMEDNGIGLTLEQSREALSTIGLSTKRRRGQKPETSPYMGRFGIGILSAFLVADEITILSRHSGGGAESVHWVGNINGTFETKSSASLESPGTRVYLHLRPDAATEFGAERVFAIARKYGAYLPHPIQFRSATRQGLINDEVPLWDRSMDDAQTLIAQGEEIFEEHLVSVFPFQCSEAAARGVVFIKDQSCYPAAESTHVLFIKRMLVSERALDLAPQDAPFLSVLLNADLLTPNAGRDAVMSNDTRLPALRRAIDAALLAHLQWLDKTEPGRLARIVLAQYRCFAQMARRDRAYLRFLTEYLPLQTSLGALTLTEIFRRHASIVEYVTDSTEFQRLQAKARSEGECVVCVETDAAHRLIELVSDVSEGSKVKRITSGEYLARFTSKAPSISNREKLVLNAVAVELTKENCVGIFCESDDPDDIARLDLGDDESLERFLSSQDQEPSASKRLMLNRMHPLISQMIDGATDETQLRVWLRVVYHLAMLQAREVPTAAETRRFGRALGNIFTAATLVTP